MIYSFNSKIAEKYGIDGAIIIQNIIFWINKNKANSKHLYNNYYWTYNSIKAFSKLFPFWSKPQIKRILTKLKKSGVIATGNYNKVKYDRTLWYTIIDKSIFQISQIDFPISENGFAEIVSPIPDTKPYTKHIKESAKADTPKKIRKLTPSQQVVDYWLNKWKKAFSSVVRIEQQTDWAVNVKLTNPIVKQLRVKRMKELLDAWFVDSDWGEKCNFEYRQFIEIKNINRLNTKIPNRKNKNNS